MSRVRDLTICPPRWGSRSFCPPNAAECRDVVPEHPEAVTAPQDRAPSESFQAVRSVRGVLYSELFFCSHGRFVPRLALFVR